MPLPQTVEATPAGLGLQGVAFVTGGASGLGLAVACAYAREGAKGVAIIDVQPEEIMQQAKRTVEAIGTECLAIQCDVTKETEVRAAVANVVAKFGRLDYAANFAGVGGSSAMIQDLDIATVKQVCDVNVFGMIYCVKYQIAQMEKQEPIIGTGKSAQRGSIINCASINASMSMPGSLPYSTSKAAVLGLTRTAALEARHKQIRVNALSPGFIRTPIVQRSLDNKTLPMEVWTAFERRQGREAGPYEIGTATALLSSPKMSLVVGQNLHVDGGFSIDELS